MGGMGQWPVFPPDFETWLCHLLCGFWASHLTSLSFHSLVYKTGITPPTSGSGVRLPVTFTKLSPCAGLSSGSYILSGRYILSGQVEFQEHHSSGPQSLPQSGEGNEDCPS
jgi:hypothetical protein